MLFRTISLHYSFLFLTTTKTVLIFYNKKVLKNRNQSYFYILFCHRTTVTTFKKKEKERNGFLLWSCQQISISPEAIAISEWRFDRHAGFGVMTAPRKSTKCAVCFQRKEDFMDMEIVWQSEMSIDITGIRFETSKQLNWRPKIRGWLTTWSIILSLI